MLFGSGGHLKGYKPHVILHIGSSKTGSTALQAACRKHAAALLAAGVLYPKVSSHAISHHFLGMHFISANRLLRIFGKDYAGSQKGISADFNNQWKSIKRQVARHKPDVLLLSSELLFVVPDSQKAAALLRLLDDLAGSLQVVAYIRRPSDFYLSRVQQDLKHSDNLMPPAAIAFRAVIESWEQLLGVPVQLAPFARECLRDGDIFRDFIDRYLPQVDLADDLVAGRENQTLSPEGMALLQDFHRANKSAGGVLQTENARRFRSALKKAERLEGKPAKPALFPEIADYIDRSSTDLLWLDERYGIRFQGIRLDLIGAGGVRSFQKIAQVAEICEIDSVRKEALLLGVVQQLLSARIGFAEFLLSRYSRFLPSNLLLRINRVVRYWRAR